jgi:uncharacterized protein
MMNFGLTDTALDAIKKVLADCAGVQEAIIFGSRAMGREHRRSDIDIALVGDLQPLDAEGIALELDDLPLPFHFDVHLARELRHWALREHVGRVGKLLYRREPS